MNSLSLQQDNFKNFLVKSLVFHVFVFLIFTVKANFFPSEDIIIRQAVRVDMVALPDKISKPKAKPKATKKTPKKAKKNKTKKKKAPGQKAIKNKQKAALNRLKAMQALENISQEVEEEEKVKEYKGNVVSKGDSLTGLDKLEFDEYFAKLKKHVKSNWDLPQWLSESGLSAKVLVTFDERGFITKKGIIESSGNEIFDSKTLAAVEAASPLPPPPNRLKGVFASQGAIFSFP